MLPSKNWPTAKTAMTAPIMTKSGQNWTMATIKRQHEANQRSDIGNEADQAGEQADQKAEIQTDDHETDGVDHAQDEGRHCPARG